MSVEPDSERATMKSGSLRDLAIGVAGGIAGAIAGYYLFHVLLRQGFYAMVLPGALTGIAGGYLVRRKTVPVGIVCAILGACSSILAEWTAFPFVKDESFTYFVTHLHQLKPMTIFMMVVGTLMAFWFGVGRDRGESR